MSIFGSFWRKGSKEAGKAPQTGKWRLGDRIANRYEVHNIFCGGMGVVYACYDHKEKNSLALKTFRDEFILSEEVQGFFEREALVWIKLEEHPFILIDSKIGCLSHWNTSLLTLGVEIP